MLEGLEIGRCRVGKDQQYPRTFVSIEGSREGIDCIVGVGAEIGRHNDQFHRLFR